MFENAKKIIRFCNGESLGEICNENGSHSSIIDIYNYDDDMLENDHYFIQWIFPTTRLSLFNYFAPILTIKEINYLKTRTDIRDMLNAFGIKMLKYWGLMPYDKKKIKILNGHNGLRLSRFIECLTLFEIDISELFPILEEAEHEGILKPKYIEHNGENITIWKKRYLENIE